MRHWAHVRFPTVLACVVVASVHYPPQFVPIRGIPRRNVVITGVRGRWQCTGRCLDGARRPSFERTGIRVTAFPVRLDTLPIGTLDELIPRPSAWMTSYFALHEWIGCAYYRLMR